MSYMLGYGMNVWRAGDYYFWGEFEASAFSWHGSWSLLTRLLVPMVAPFCGCTFGGFLYDVFLFTGESPINTEALGLARLLPQHWNRKTWSNTYSSSV